VSVKATECERIKPEFLDEERREKTADCFAQEYMCEFTAMEDSLFDKGLILAALDDSVTELNIRRPG